YTAELGEAEQAIVQMFNESQQDVRVEYQFQGTYEETAQKLTAALQARQAPDVSLLSDVWWFRFYLANALAPLNDLIAANEVDTADYVESLYNEGVRDGVSYWLPMARSTPLFYYNVDAFAEVGLEEAPEFWSELVEVAPDLVKKDGDTVTRAAFAHPTGASYIAWLFQGVIWQHQGAYSDPDFTIRINEPNGVRAGEFYRSSVADGWAMTTSSEVEIDFINGLTASIMASTGSLRQLTEGIGDRFEFRSAFLPKAEEFGCCTGGAGLAIMAGSPPEKQEAAFKFVEYVTSTEGTTFWSQNTGYMPVRKSAVESEEMQAFFEENPNFRTAVEQLPLTRPQDAARVFIPNGDQIIGAGLERIVINFEDPQVVFDEVANTLTEEAQPVIEAIAALG
ncbi:MAG: extracellular solute-binding protein family 1, partial [Thermomicrobiales bacterium]|nr:extracellular solute-binding protein family 1 [Thermomicrobiales bacterium]